MTFLAAVAVCAGAGFAAADKPACTATVTGAGPAALVALPLRLPKPAFIGTPKNIPPGTTVEKPSGKLRPPFRAPEGSVNLALNRPVDTGGSDPLVGESGQITDGDKEAADGSWVEFGRGLKSVTIDLGAPAEIAAVVLWHYHGDPRVVHDVVIQSADDADFIGNARVLFNNDADNTAGLGAGRDREYFETYEGRLIDAKLVRARYLKFWSSGSTADEMNRYTEIEIWGRF